MLLLLAGLLAACSWPAAPAAAPTLALTPRPLTVVLPTARPTAVPTMAPSPVPRPSATQLPPPQRQADLLLTRADLALRDGDHETTLDLLQQVLREHPGTPAADEATLDLAWVYMEMGEPLSATEVLGSALDALPPEPRHRAHYLIAEALNRAGDCSGALPYYERYLEEGTTLEDLVAQRMAWCYHVMGDYARAAQAFTEAASPYRPLSNQVGLLEQAAQDLRDIGAYDEAVLRYERILELARIPWYRATILHRMAELLVQAGRTAEAQARWQQALNDHPDTTAASWAADALLAAGLTVSPYAAARAYSAANRSSEAVPWFEEALRQGDGPPADVRAALAQARAAAGDLNGAVAELEFLFRLDPTDPHFLLEQGTLLERRGSLDRALDAYRQVEQRFPEAPQAGDALWLAGDLLEDRGQVDEAVAAYAALLERFPHHEQASEARFRAGMLRYRQGRLTQAAELWAGEEEEDDLPRAALWRGLAQQEMGDEAGANAAWTEAAAGEGYYAARARELLSDEAGFGQFHDWPIWQDETRERAEAEQWLAAYWRRPVSASLPAAVRADPFFARGEELLSLSRPDEAAEPFTLLMERFRYDGPALYSLALYFRENHLYGLSIRCAGKIVSMASPRLDQAPSFILRLLYPTPYAHLIVSEAHENGVDPLLFFALVRQESLFDRYATSPAEARGLTQVIPSTGQWIAQSLGFSPFRLEDLYRPMVSVPFGVWYIAQQLNSFAGQAIPALSAYNGGPGNAQRWAGYEVPVADMDLFVEAVDFSETRGYIERIYTSYWRYRRLYSGSLSHPPRWERE